MTAGVIAIEGTRLVCLPEYPGERRKKLLGQLARRVLAKDQSLSDEEFAVLLAAFACKDHAAPKVAAIWAELLEHMDLLAQMADRTIHWSAIDPDLTCMDKYEAAEEIARERVGDALSWLAFGSTITTARGSGNSNGGLTA